jgi:hypothetical protein
MIFKTPLRGAAGARHIARPEMPGSRNTLLRRVPRLSIPEAPPPRAVSIDDWAKRKSHTYRKQEGEPCKQGIGPQVVNGPAAASGLIPSTA